MSSEKENCRAIYALIRLNPHGELRTSLMKALGLITVRLMIGIRAWFRIDGIWVARTSVVVLPVTA
jgi:hypothetical protein